MKQGRATVSGPLDRKVEPKSHAVSECAVSEIGSTLSYRGETLYKGRGYKAPVSKDECHHCGSQGKH